mgnify:FL=1
MEPPKKSRKWRFKKVKKIGPHSSKYQKDYQKYTHEPVKTHRYTSTQHIQNTHSSTEQHSNLYIRVHRSTAQHTSTQVWHTVATKATAWVTVTPGGHSVSVQNRINLVDRASNGIGRVPVGPLPLILNRNL